MRFLFAYLSRADVLYKKMRVKTRTKIYIKTCEKIY